MAATKSKRASKEQLLGEIKTRIAGMQYYDSEVRPGEHGEPREGTGELARREFDPGRKRPVRAGRAPAPKIVLVTGTADA